MRLQGAISPRVEARLDEMLGHPETCPHGNPIDAATARRRPAGMPLSRDGGRHARHDLPDHRGGRGGRRAAVVPRGAGADARARTITILARSESLDSLTLDGPRGRATLGLRPAALVRVLPGEADPALFHRVPAARPLRSMTDRPRPDRAEPDRAAPHRDGAHGAVQLPARPARRRHVHPPPRGHRRGPQHDRVTRRTSSTACTGSGCDWDEGPEVAGEAARGPHAPYRQMERLPIYAAAAAAAARRRPGLSLLLHARGARRGPQGAGGGQAAAALRRPLREPDPRGARGARGRGPPRRPPLPGRGGGRRLRRHRPRPRRDRRRATSAATSSSSAPTARRSTTSRSSSTTRRWRSADVIRGEDHLSNTPKHILLFRALGYEPCRGSPTCRSSSTPTARR